VKATIPIESYENKEVFARAVSGVERDSAETGSALTSPMAKPASAS
jgi:hypothetical protein